MYDANLVMRCRMHNFESCLILILRYAPNYVTLHKVKSVSILGIVHQGLSMFYVVICIFDYNTAVVSKNVNVMRLTDVRVKLSDNSAAQIYKRLVNV